MSLSLLFMDNVWRACFWAVIKMSSKKDIPPLNNSNIAPETCCPSRPASCRMLASAWANNFILLTSGWDVDGGTRIHGTVAAERQNWLSKSPGSGDFEPRCSMSRIHFQCSNLVMCIGKYDSTDSCKYFCSKARSESSSAGRDEEGHEGLAWISSSSVGFESPGVSKIRTVKSCQLTHYYVRSMG